MKIEEELATTNPSTSDAATGLSNRRGLSAIGKHLLTLCRRGRRPAALLVVRFANLANIDESFGYSEGDRAVIELVELLKASFPGADLIGRPTIDSFGILFAGSTLDSTQRACDYLNELVVDRNARDCDYELTLRTEGVTYRPGHHSDVEEMIQEAENRLDNPQHKDVLEPLMRDVVVS